MLRKKRLLEHEAGKTIVVFAAGHVGALPAVLWSLLPRRALA